MVRTKEDLDLADASWSRLRMAIADEFISKLPDAMSIGAVSQLLKMPERDVRGRIRTGEIIARDTQNGVFIVPEDNRAFFRKDMMLHLPLPEPWRSRQHSRGIHTLGGSAPAHVS